MCVCIRFRYKVEDAFQSLKMVFFKDFGIASVSGDCVGFKTLIFTRFSANWVENEKVGREFYITCGITWLIQIR